MVGCTYCVKEGLTASKSCQQTLRWVDNVGFRSCRECFVEDLVCSKNNIATEKDHGKSLSAWIKNHIDYDPLAEKPSKDKRKISQISKSSDDDEDDDDSDNDEDEAEKNDENDEKDDTHVKTEKKKDEDNIFDANNDEDDDNDNENENKNDNDDDNDVIHVKTTRSSKIPQSGVKTEERSSKTPSKKHSTSKEKPKRKRPKLKEDVSDNGNNASSSNVSSLNNSNDTLAPLLQTIVQSQVAMQDCLAKVTDVMADWSAVMGFVENTRFTRFVSDNVASVGVSPQLSVVDRREVDSQIVYFFNDQTMWNVESLTDTMLQLGGHLDVGNSARILAIRLYENVQQREYQAGV